MSKNYSKYGETVRTAPQLSMKDFTGFRKIFIQKTYHQNIHRLIHTKTWKIVQNSCKLAPKEPKITLEILKLYVLVPQFPTESSIKVLLKIRLKAKTPKYLWANTYEKLRKSPNS